ncbi:MAG: DUF2911 domain-containing protein [Chitinophagaceae bacterium]|nr:DUF2911 domain-containing protein [Chitinophagaceae bacterium]
MLPTTRLTVLAMFISLYAIPGCRHKPPPQRELLPIPGSHAAVADRVIRPAFDKSPMDMIYYPVDYPVLKMSGKTSQQPIARVIYSRPEKNGRVIFGNVVKYSEHWRLGANEATEIEFFTDVSIQNKKIRKGRYILYCIPYPDKWTLILNDDLFVWGLRIHSSKDIYSFDVPASTTGDVYEAFTMQFEPGKEGMQLVMAWDNAKAVLPISF